MLRGKKVGTRTTWQKLSGGLRSTRLPAILVTVGLCGIGALLVGQTSSGASTTVMTVKGSGANCKVTLDIGSTSVTANILSGCQGGDYYLSTWVAQSNVHKTSLPQYLYRTTNHAPWTVALPPCFYQVDFARLSSPPSLRATSSGAAHTGRVYIAGALGGAACRTTTTTSGPTTTLPKSTTTTTEPTTTSSSTTSTTVHKGTTTTSTTTHTKPPTTLGTTTTTTTTHHPDGPGGVAGTSSGGSGTPPTHGGSLAFTGFAVLMGVFIAMCLIGCGLGILRASRGSSAGDLDILQ